jgi:hypothetical protein
LGSDRRQDPQPDNALHLIDEIIAQVERPGWEERLHYAEILRLTGWMLSLTHRPVT